MAQTNIQPNIPSQADMTATLAAMQAELARLQADNAALKAAKNKALTFKIGEKGGLSVCGLGRFPVTLYPRQWLRLIAVASEVKAFITANHSAMSWKDGDSFEG